jgi:hypothetical protein
MKKASLVFAVAILSACASQPEDIATTYVSPIKYQDYSCKQLGMEIDHISRRTTALYASLDKKADRDAAQMAGGIILWPFLFGLEGGDGSEAVEYANLKGEYEATREAMVAKECSLTNLPPSPQEMAEKIKAQEEAEAAKKHEGKNK